METPLQFSSMVRSYHINKPVTSFCRLCIRRGRVMRDRSHFAYFTRHRLEFGILCLTAFLKTLAVIRERVREF